MKTISLKVSMGKRGITFVRFLDSDPLVEGGGRSATFYNPVNVGGFPNIEVGEKYLLQILGKEKIAEKKTKDNRTIIFCNVKILHRVEKPCGGWFEEETGIFHERYLSGDIHGERKIPAYEREFYALDKKGHTVVLLQQAVAKEDGRPLGDVYVKKFIEEDEFLSWKRAVYRGLKDPAKAANDELRNLPEYSPKTHSLVS